MEPPAVVIFKALLQLLLQLLILAINHLRLLLGFTQLPPQFFVASLNLFHLQTQQAKLTTKYLISWE